MEERTSWGDVQSGLRANALVERLHQIVANQFVALLTELQGLAAEQSQSRAVYRLCLRRLARWCP